jgi:3-oxoacyl-[acyl-carrier-protein] synthase-1
MSAPPIAIKNAGLVTSVGLSAPATCAAIRAKISNASETRFIDSRGEWIMAHQVTLVQPWRGRTKLVKMAAMAIVECLASVPHEEWLRIPMLLVVAECERPGRLDGLDDRLLDDIQRELHARFSKRSTIVALGRVGVANAIAQARDLICEGKAPKAIVVATDSFLTWPTLSVYERAGRLLSAGNSNGFMPGEAAGALLLARPEKSPGEFVCTGIGFGREPAPIESAQPLRAEGLAQAIDAALVDAGIQLHDMNCRITDISGEEYYFKEAALAILRTLRGRRGSFDIWHPAECTGEVGAATGTTIIASAKAACDKHYAGGAKILAHMANDAGQRAALSLGCWMAA